MSFLPFQCLQLHRSGMCDACRGTFLCTNGAGAIQRVLRARHAGKHVIELLFERTNTVVQLSFLIRDLLGGRRERRALHLTKVGLKGCGTAELRLGLVALAAPQAPFEFI